MIAAIIVTICQLLVPGAIYAFSLYAFLEGLGRPKPRGILGSGILFTIAALSLVALIWVVDNVPV